MPAPDKPVAALTEDQRARLEEFTPVAGIGLIVIALLVHLARSRVAAAPA